jgi:hypothetical protein
MGENKHIEEIDAFAKKYVKEIPTESPSVDFTANLMHTISKLKMEKPTVYKPLISKKGWFLVFVAVIAVILVPFKSTEEGLFTLPEMDLSFFEKLNFSGLFESVQVSNTTMYVAILFSVLVFVQIFYLKGYFEKRINS